MSPRRRIALPLAVMTVLAGTAGIGLVVERLPERGVARLGPTTAVAPVSSDRDLFDHHFRLGVELLRRGRAAESAEFFELARGLKPHVAEVDANLGFAYLELGKPAEAAAAFRKALDLRREQVNAYYGLGEALDRLGDRAGALGAMRTFIHLAPEDDSFRRRAMSAVWEWEAARKQDNGPAQKPPGKHSGTATSPATSPASPHLVKTPSGVARERP